MKIAAFLLVWCFCVIQGAVINNPEDDLRKSSLCVRRSRVQPETLRELQFGKFEDDDRLKEYLWCISTISGYQDQEGYLQKDAIRIRMKAGHFSEDAINDVVELCTEQKETPQETAFQFMRCFYGQVFPKNYT